MIIAINWGDKGNGQTYFLGDGDGERDNILVWRLDGEGIRDDNMSFLGEEFFDAAGNIDQFLNNVGLMWLAVGVGGLLFRTVHLFFLQGFMAGIAWATKITTDPFHDVMLYYRAPMYLMRGELIDPMHARH